MKSDKADKIEHTLAEIIDEWITLIAVILYAIGEGIRVWQERKKNR